MGVDRVVPILTVTDLPQAVAEHSAVLGLRVLMDHGWIVTLGDDEGHQLGRDALLLSCIRRPCHQCRDAHRRVSD